MMFKHAISSKIAITALFVPLIFLGNIKFKQWQKQLQIAKAKQGLEEQADALEKKNRELSQSLRYLNSLSFKERVAREQLGLKKQDEQVYLFSEAPQVLGAVDSKQKQSNWKKWLDYFFNIR